MKPTDPGTREQPRINRRIEIKPVAYLKPDRPIAPGGGNIQRIVLARQGRRKADPNPDRQTPDVTGRYECEQHEPGTGHPVLGYLLHVNQAGTALYGAFVEVLDARTSRARRLLPFTGVMLDDGRFSLLTDGENDEHLLAADPQGVRVSLSELEGNRELVFKLTEGRRATLFADALDAMLSLNGGAPPQDLALLRAVEETPLSFAQIARLRRLLDPAVIGQLLSAFHAVGSEIGSSSHLWRANAAEKLDAYIGHVFSTKAPDGWHTQDLPQLQHAARLMLTSDRHRFGSTTKSPIQWIEEIATAVTQSRVVARDVPNLRTHLGIHATKGAAPSQRFEYQIELDLKAKARNVLARWTKFLKIEGYYGEVTVTRLKYTAAPGKGRRAEVYRLWLGGGGLEASTKFVGGGDIKASGTFSTEVEWAFPDFLGWVKLLDGGYWAGVKPSELPRIKDVKKQSGPIWDVAKPATKHLDKTYEVVPASRELALIVHGNGSHERLIIPLSMHPSAKHGAGASFTAAVGKLFKLDDSLEQQDFGREVKSANVPVRRAEQQETHFQLGVALLTGLARIQIRMFCAKERAWLCHPGSRMLIVGHADRIDTPERNIELSRLRAENVRQCLMDVLGDKLAFRDEIELRFLGEQVAASLGIKDGRPSPEWRKVELFLDGRQVLTLWGEA